jgi:hypothetical protein
MTDANMRGGDFARPPLERSFACQRLIKIDEETTGPPLQRSGGQPLTKIDDQEGSRPPSTIESHDSARSFLIKQMMPADSGEQISTRSSAIKEAKENKPGGNKITPSVKFKQQSEDILTEGQYYLGISMLVYMYSHLRETCRMGHTRVKMEDIDVNSHHSHAFSRTEKKFLEFTMIAGSIVRVLVDELAHKDDDGKKNESKKGNRRMSIRMEPVSATIDEEYQKRCDPSPAVSRNCNILCQDVSSHSSLTCNSAISPLKKKT